MNIFRYWYDDISNLATHSTGVLNYLVPLHAYNVCVNSQSLLSIVRLPMAFVFWIIVFGFCILVLFLCMTLDCVSILNLLYLHLPIWTDHRSASLYWLQVWFKCFDTSVWLSNKYQYLQIYPASAPDPYSG